MSWTSGVADNYMDFVDRLDAFLNQGHSLRPTYNVAGAGALLHINGTNTSVHETITVTFSSSTGFTVSGSVTGIIGSGTVGTRFVGSVVAFDTVAGFTSGDTVVFTMTKPWQTQLKQLTRRDTVISSNLYNPAQLFDHNSTTYSYASAFPCWAGIIFNRPVALQKLGMTVFQYAGNFPTSFSLDWSDDNGSTWTIQQTFSGLSWVPNETKTWDLGTPTAVHGTWRVQFLTSQANVYVADVFFVEPGIPDSKMFAVDVSARSQCQFVWKAPGDDGQQAIYTGLRESYNVSQDAYCWQVYGAANYDTDLANGDPASQLRAYYGEGITLRNSTINYWFIATGSYVTIIANISTVYVSAHMGLLQLYSNSERFTYPLVIAACLAAGALPSRWSAASNINVGFWCGFINGVTDTAYVRMLKQDGSVLSFRGDDFNGHHVHPGRYLQNLNKNRDGSVQMFPIILYTSSNFGSCFGQLQGMQQISGDDVLSGDIINVGKIKYMAVQGVYETSKTTYAAVELV